MLIVIFLDDKLILELGK